MTSDQPRANNLQELIVRRLAELGDETGPMSSLQAVEAADGAISYENFRQIARGNHGGRLRPRTAEGLAKALRVPVADVYRAAGLPASQGPWEWPARFQRLDPRQRELVEDVAAALLEARERGRQERS